MPGLTRAGREVLLMVVHVLTFSEMRSIEVHRLTPDDVQDRLIRIGGSKTESSGRIVPLHPEHKFPDWVRGGGLGTFDTITSDRVVSVRHSFGRLVRKHIPDPIQDPQKALYSFRTTFVMP